MSSDPLSKTRHFLALDGLRGVAALAVVSLHISEYFQLPFVPIHAYLAVDFFFLLSGFVIAYAYDKRLAHGMGLGAFFTVRLIRLYPLVLLGVMLGTAALLVRAHTGGGISISSILQAAAANALLLPSPAMTYLRPYAFPTDSPLWSLAFELWINILYAAAFRYVTKARLGVTMAVGAVLVGWTALSWHGLNVGYEWSIFYLGGIRVLFPFAAGVLLARLFRPSAPQWKAAHLAFIPLVAVLAAPPLAGGVFDAAAVLLVFPAIVFVGSRAAPSRWLDPIWRPLGAMSYPLYAIHYPFVVVLSNLAHQHGLRGVKLAAAAAGTLFIVVGLTWLVIRIYDTPVRQALTSTARRVRVGARA